MKTQLITPLVIILISIGLVACGTNTSNFENDVQIDEDILSQDDSATDNAEINDPDNEPDKNSMIWYMDTDGIKNEELGIVIKDTSLLSNMYMFASITHETNNNMWYVLYYEKSLDDFVNKMSELGPDITCETHQYETIDYALLSLSWNDLLVFINNGIMVVAFVDTTSLDEFMNDNIEVYSTNNTEYLAYTTSDGLYCPALGLKMVPNDGSEIYVGIDCDDYSTYGTKFRIANGNNTAQTAQEKLDLYIEEHVENNPSTWLYTISAIDGTIETHIGNYDYLGKGISITDTSINVKSEEYMFVSDDTTWCIIIGYDEGETYENYLDIIKNL